MESDPIKSDTEFISSTSIDGSDLIQHSDTEEDDDSHTEGRPSPPPPKSTVISSAKPPLLPAIQDDRRHSPSTDTDRSTSPTRSKKRAIDTMLDGEEDKECIVMEKPPLPKRQTPPSPTKSAKTSSSSPSSPSSPPTFMDHAIYVKGDANYDQACTLLDSYRQHEGTLETGALILDFFDQWIKGINPSSVNIVDALFELLLEDYNPTTDEQLLSRIPLVMNQILLRKRKESLQQLFRVTILAVQLTLNHLSNIDVNIDYQKLKGAFEFFKTIDTFTFQLPPPISAQQPRAFSGFAYDKPPFGGLLISFRFVLLSQYCRPAVLTRFFQLVQDYASVDGLRYPVLSMMTLIGEVSLNIFKCYKTLRPVAKLKERLRMPNPEIDLDDNFSQIHDTMRHLGKFIYNYLVKLMRTESNPTILSLAQLTMTTNFLRLFAIDLGPLDTDEKTDITPVIAAMQMTARLAFEGFATETKRLDLFDWSVNWYKRQMELDYGKGFSQKVTDPDAVGPHGILYVGEIFRDRRVLDYLTTERVFPGALPIALIFILFALRHVNALSSGDLDALYTRFVQNSNHELYCRAYWEGIRQVISNFDQDIIRTILSQIQRSDWWKVYFHHEPHTVIVFLLSSIVDVSKDKTKTSAVDNMAIINTVQCLLRGIAANDIDDVSFRSAVSDILLRLFPSYPVTGEERNRLTSIFFQNASAGPTNQRGGDLQLLRTLLLTEPTEIISGWDRDNCMSRLCHKKPSLPEIILEDLAYWKSRQYASGVENAQRSPLVECQVQFLIQVLAADKFVSGGYQFPREVLEEFWSTALIRSGEDPGLEAQFWGGDGVTESLRLILFHNLSGIDFRHHSGLDVPFARFFIDEKLPGVNMMALKTMGWDFIVKGIEFLDTQLGLEYISTPLPLLWKIIRESLPCSAYAIKFMTSRLLKANVPSSVHKQFVESAIDAIVEIGDRHSKTDAAPSNQDLYKFRATFETLSQFLSDYKKSVHERDEPSTPSSASDSMDIEEKKMIIARCTQSSGQKEYRDIQFSPDTTVKIFQETLASKLSLLRFRLFAQGREITRKESEQVKTLQEWGFKELEAIMIQVQERAKEEAPQVRKVSNCELWVSARFDDIHRLLSGEPRLAYVVNRFLVVRPPEPKLVEKLRNLETPWEQLFSFLCPWDLHYTLSVLQQCVERFMKDDPEFEWVVAFGDKYHDKIIHLVEWLSQPPLATSPDWPYSFGLAVPILNALMVKCVGSPWQRTIPVERLVRAMLNYWAHIARQDLYLFSSVMHILRVLSTIDAVLWLSIIEPEFEPLFFAVAVEHPNEATREAAWTSFGELFTYCSVKAFAVINGNSDQNDSDAESKMEIDHHPDRDIVTYLWRVTLNCLKKTGAFISFAGKAFDTGANILRMYYQALSSSCPEDGKELLQDMSSLARSQLFDHTVQESVLNSAVDYITLGWTRMLHVCFDLMSPNEIDAIIPRNFSHQVISTFLFPALPSQDIENPPPMKPYCIHSETRGALFDLVFKLLDIPKRNVISSFVHTILEADSEVFPDDHYIDRSSWVQASSRLTGIHNLSNTCYMNSLVNQLFMNVDFRNFIFSVEVDDPNGNQNLLHQLQFLFARLQLGNDKAAYPQELAHSIIDFEGHPINIHVQMDVDEFFNLLFHRIEAQFKNNQERIRFRKLYGGVLCHTIKSRECPHVSSREEDFAAIQCDVRGKNTLEDSLASYVSGEMMDGDNKYSCEACGRHVDAVKQISIKSLPDNLIFHLKRFEYVFDIGKRIKVNDWFQFPREIDLFPYTMGHIEMQEKGIKRPKEETQEIYELVGVLVHTGTAESGHYYSYIRDPRPRDSVPDPKVQWFEFNDSEVKPWRIEELDHWCFGGQELNYDPTFFPEPPFKSYSAYMLFYRKRTEALSVPQAVPAVQLPPSNLKAQVQRYNDYFIRRYVIFGEDLSAFVAKLLRSMPQKETSRLEECEIQQLDDHIHDLYPLVLGLQVYRLVVSRLDFRSSVEKYCVALKSAIRSSPAARHYFYTWLQKTPGCLKELLLTNLNDKARSQSAQLISSALIGNEVAKPRSHNPDNGIDILDLEVVKNVIVDLTNLVYLAGDNWRSWSEYFETLALIAKDPDWARLIIEENTIANCAYHFIHSIFPRGSNVPRGFGRLKYPDNDRIRPNFKKVIALLAQLLPLVIVPPSNPTEERNFVSLDEPGLITDDEFELIFFEWESDYPLSHVRRSSVNLFVHRLFETSCDVPDVVIIIKWMLTESMLRENMTGQKVAIMNSLHRQADPSNPNAGEALDVIWKLLEETAEEDERWRTLLLQVIRRIGTWSDALRESFYGQEYLSFWKMIYEYGDEDFKEIIVANLPHIASQLMFSNETHVRDQTATWLQSLVPKLAEDEEVETVVVGSIPNLYQRLVTQTEYFLDRKIIITERLPSPLSVVVPVLQTLRLISVTFPYLITDNIDVVIEGLQERAKLIHEFDSNYFYGDSDDEMEDMETDDEESIVESSPYP